MGKSLIQSVEYRSGEMGLKSRGGVVGGDKVAKGSKLEQSEEGQGDNIKECLYFTAW